MAEFDKAICCQLPWQVRAWLLAATKTQHFAIHLLELLYTSKIQRSSALLPPPKSLKAEHVQSTTSKGGRPHPEFWLYWGVGSISLLALPLRRQRKTV